MPSQAIIRPGYPRRPRRFRPWRSRCTGTGSFTTELTSWTWAPDQATGLPCCAAGSATAVSPLSTSIRTWSKPRSSGWTSSACAPTRPWSMRPARCLAATTGSSPWFPCGPSPRAGSTRSDQVAVWSPRSPTRPSSSPPTRSPKTAATPSTVSRSSRSAASSATGSASCGPGAAPTIPPVSTTCSPRPVNRTANTSVKAATRCSTFGTAASWTRCWRSPPPALNAVTRNTRTGDERRG